MILENGQIKLEVSDHGAEPTSLVFEGREYLWQADPAFWKRHAPILFPIVGQVYDKTYRTPRGEFHLGQHGFARDREFTPGSVPGEWTLVWDNESLKVYPYKFLLTAKYTLNDRTVEIEWTVKNVDSEDMFFSIGAHPAFNYPDFNPEDEIHGYMRFFDKNGAEVHPKPTSVIEKGFRVDAVAALPLECPWPVGKYSFNLDAVLIEGSQVYSTLLLDKNQKPVLKVSSESPALGIWSPDGQNAPFVCIEPWKGITDRLEYSGQFADKDLVERLAPGESRTFRYDITVLRGDN